MESAVPMHDDTYQRELGDGLVLRWSRPDDIERAVEMYAHVFRPRADAPPNAHMPFWVRDMFSGRHPHIGPRDFAVVEEPRAERLVASTCLLRYTCDYDGIPFLFGRPEIVGSLPDVRRRGLIRAIFELIHAKSEARGDLVQGITGIPYYYRQFGYDFAVELEYTLTVYFPAIPELKKEATEPYALREATLDDLPLLRRLAERERAGALVSTVITEDYWRWVLDGMHAEAMERWRPYLITQADGRQVGYLRLMPARWGAEVYVDGLMVEEGVPLASVVPSVLRGVRALAETVKPIRTELPSGAIKFRLWRGHPLPASLGEVAFVEGAHPYPWYIRVPNLPRFLHHIRPALERRLAASPQAGYTGELTLDFYRGGLRLAFENGKITVAEDWQRGIWDEPKAAFPPLVFSQLLFGYRSLDELRDIFPDVWAEGDGGPLLTALFPKRPSMLVPLD